MALNYIKSGDQALVVIVEDIVVPPGAFHIIGKQLGIAIAGGVQGDEIAVALVGVWNLPCEGPAFEPGVPLHFAVENMALYAGVAAPSDFENVAVAWSAGGDTLTICKAKINAHIATLTEAP